MQLTIQDRCNYDLIPPHMMDALRRYTEHHEDVGDFLYAVITNDLGRAVGHADGSNLWIIPIYAVWLYNNAPSTCWGSREAYKTWTQ